MNNGPGEIVVQLLTTEITQWDNYVKENSDISVYHLLKWRDVIIKTFGHSSYYFIARDTKNNIIGILPLIHLKSFLFGNYMVSMPYFNYGGAIGSTAEIESILIHAANKKACEIGVSHIEYRDTKSRNDMPTRQDKVSMVLSLPNSEEELWKSFTSKLRSQIKRPLRESPTVRIGKLELLNDFYSVFSHNMRDLGTPVYSKSFFKNILTAFPSETYILTISLGKKAVSAAFLIGYNNTLEVPWASSLRRYNNISINMFMYWEILRFSIREGFHKFDFGRSSKDAGTYKFKLQWGARPQPLYWHYWLHDGNEIPALNPSNPKYKFFIRIWQRLPITVTNMIGPWIVKNLP